VNVACGHDSIMDPWYPLGRGSMLDALSMLVHVAQMTGRTELFRAYEMVTTNPARAAEVPWGVKEGLPANFVVFDCADEAEAIRLRPAARWVVRNGRIVAETEPARSTVHVDGSARPVTYRRDAIGAATAAVPSAEESNGSGRRPVTVEKGVDA
jgi:cytosine deaminase